MIYTPQKNPKKALTLITWVVIIGILGGIFIHELILITAIIFWMQYTLVLSYNQLKKKKKHKWNTLTEIMLHAPIRLLVFETAAIAGLIAIIRYNKPIYGAITLTIWWIFAYNFYYHYTKKTSLK